tara:strand:- start:2088 stop:2423 length:336 start_codon:yes stop_codon:yes gene_type:complete
MNANLENVMIAIKEYIEQEINDRFEDIDFSSKISDAVDNSIDDAVENALGNAVSNAVDSALPDVVDSALQEALTNGIQRLVLEELRSTACLGCIGDIAVTAVAAKLSNRQI